MGILWAHAGAIGCIVLGLTPVARTLYAPSCDPLYTDSEIVTSFYSMICSMNTGVDNPGHPFIMTVGCVAGDEETYDVFADLLDKVIDTRHGGYGKVRSTSNLYAKVRSTPVYEICMPSTVYRVPSKHPWAFGIHGQKRLALTRRSHLYV